MKTIRLIFCLVILGTASYGSTFTPRGMYAEDIEKELESAGGAVRVNLQNKPLCFASADRIFDETEANKILGRLPDALEILDLSLNRLPEEALVGLASLLLKDTFRYLDVTTNSGADSIEAIRGLVTYLTSKEIIGNAAVPYLSKIIWVRNERLESAAERGILKGPLLDSHRQYYEMKSELDMTSAVDLWGSLGIK